MGYLNLHSNSYINLPVKVSGFVSRKPTESIFIIFTAIGLIAIAGIDTYGLYIAIGIFWIVSAINKSLTIVALWSIAVFMSGFALMRIISIYTGNEINLVNLSLLVIEILLAYTGFLLIKKRRNL